MALKMDSYRHLEVCNLLKISCIRSNHVHSGTEDLPSLSKGLLIPPRDYQPCPFRYKELGRC